jgi:hypothetical protein
MRTPFRRLLWEPRGAVYLNVYGKDSDAPHIPNSLLGPQYVCAEVSVSSHGNQVAFMLLNVCHPCSARAVCVRSSSPFKAKLPFF